MGEEYLSWLATERGRARSTLSSYRRDLAAFRAFLAERKGEEAAASMAASRGDVEEHLAALAAKGRRPASVARAAAAIRGFYRFWAEEAAIEDPCGQLESPRVPMGLPRALSEEEVEAMLGAVSGDDPLSRRDRALLELLYGSGLRISEAVGMDLDSLDLGSALAKVRGKGSKERLVPIGSATRAALSEWLAPGGRPRLAAKAPARRQPAAVFLNFRGGRLSRQGAWGVVRRHGDAAGLGDSMTPHVLRHCCATHMLAHGADLRVVQELLGHASVATTQLYTKVSLGQLIDAYGAAHPRAREQRARAATLDP